MLNEDILSKTNNFITVYYKTKAENIEAYMIYNISKKLVNKISDTVYKSDTKTFFAILNTIKSYDKEIYLKDTIPFKLSKLFS